MTVSGRFATSLATESSSVSVGEFSRSRSRRLTFRELAALGESSATEGVFCLAEAPPNVIISLAEQALAALDARRLADVAEALVELIDRFQGGT